jgi:hypothetical protein
MARVSVLIRARNEEKLLGRSQNQNCANLLRDGVQLWNCWRSMSFATGLEFSNIGSNINVYLV